MTSKPVLEQNLTNQISLPNMKCDDHLVEPSSKESTINRTQKSQPIQSSTTLPTMTSKKSVLRENLRKQISLSSPKCNDHLIGRSSEKSIIENCYYEALTVHKTSPANLVLIDGNSGLGKTRLAEKLRTYVMDDDGFFIRGKFDQSSYVSANLPYSGITNAFGEFSSQLENRPEERNRIIETLKTKLHSNERAILCAVFPSLSNLLQYEDDETASVSLGYSDPCAFSTNHLNRLKYLLKKLTCAISSLGDPIIYLLDDMQASH